MDITNIVRRKKLVKRSTLLALVGSLVIALAGLFVSFGQSVVLDAYATGPSVWDGTVATDYGGGTGTATDPYIIANAKQLAFFVSSAPWETGDSGLDVYYSLTTDIDWDGRAWTLADYQIRHMNFNGNFHTISNFTSVSSLGGYYGFFPDISGSNVHDLFLDFASVTGYNGSGGTAIGIASDSTISNVEVKNINISCNATYLGGLVGCLDDSILTDSGAVGSITNTRSAGYSYSGGLIGRMTSTQTDGCCASYCYARVNVTASASSLQLPERQQHVAGVVGKFDSGSIKNIYCEGNLSAQASKSVTTYEVATESRTENCHHDHSYSVCQGHRKCGGHVEYDYNEWVHIGSHWFCTNGSSITYYEIIGDETYETPSSYQNDNGYIYAGSKGPIPELVNKADVIAEAEALAPTTEYYIPGITTYVAGARHNSSTDTWYCRIEYTYYYSSTAVPSQGVQDAAEAIGHGMTERIEIDTDCSMYGQYIWLAEENPSEHPLCSDCGEYLERASFQCPEYALRVYGYQQNPAQVKADLNCWVHPSTEIHHSGNDLWNGTCDNYYYEGYHNTISNDPVGASMSTGGTQTLSHTVVVDGNGNSHNIDSWVDELVATAPQNCYNYTTYTSGYCGCQHTYYYQSLVSSTNTTKQGYTHAVGNDGTANDSHLQSSDWADNILYSSSSSRQGSAANYTTGGTAKSTSNLKKQSTYNTWTDFNSHWIIDSNVNNGYPAPRGAYLRTITANKQLVNDQGEPISTYEPYWLYISVSGSGQYLSQDLGLSQGSTATLSVELSHYLTDLGQNEENIGYHFVGWYKGNTLVSTNRSITVTVSQSTEGDYDARFERIAMIRPTVNVRINDGDGNYNIDNSVIGRGVSLTALPAGNFYIGTSYNFTLNITTKLYVFDGWRLSGSGDLASNPVILTGTSATNYLDGSLSGLSGNVLTGIVGKNFIATYNNNNALEISALLSEATFDITINRVMCTLGAEITDTEINTTSTSMKLGDVLTISTSTTMSGLAIKRMYYNDINQNEVEFYRYSNVPSNNVQANFTLTEDVLNNIECDLDYINNKYYANLFVEYSLCYHITTSGEIDDGYIYQGLSAHVGLSPTTVNQTDMVVFEGQAIYLGYTQAPENVGIVIQHFVQRFDGTDDPDVKLFGGELSGAVMEITGDMHIVAIYTRQEYTFEFKYFNASRELSNEDDGTKNPKSNATDLMDITVVSITGSTNKYGDAFSHIATLKYDEYKFIGYRIVDKDYADADEILNAPNIGELHGINGARLVYDFVTSDLNDKVIMVVYAQRNMSVDLSREVIENAMPDDDPCDLSLTVNGEEDNLAVSDLRTGQEVVLSATIKTGYTFAGWYRNGLLLSNSQNISIDGAGNITALTEVDGVASICLSYFQSDLSGSYIVKFAKVAYIITANTVAGTTYFSLGQASGTNTILAYIGATVSYTFASSADKQITGLKISGETDIYATEFVVDTDLIAFANQEKVISFVQVYNQKYLLTITTSNAEGHGSVYLYYSGDDQPLSFSSAKYYLPQAFDLAITPNEHYSYTITGVEESEITESGATFALAADRTIAIAFIIDKVEVNLELEEDYEEAGTLTGAGMYDYGQTIEISATANDGYKFVRWDISVEDSEPESYTTSSTFTLTIREDTTFIAIFVRQYQITTGVNDPNGITSITQSKTLNEGSSFTATVALAPGYYIEGWKLDDAEVNTTNTSSSYTLNDIDDDHSIIVYVAKLHYEINTDLIDDVYAADGYEIEAPENGEYYVYGETIHLTFTTTKFDARIDEIRLNDDAVMASRSSGITGEAIAEFDIEVNDSNFINNICTVYIYYTRIHTVTLHMDNDEGEVTSVLTNYVSYDDTDSALLIYRYRVLDGRQITLNTQDNEVYSFYSYNVYQDPEYVLLSLAYEYSLYVTDDIDILTSYVGKSFGITYNLHVVDGSGDEIENFDLSLLSAPTFLTTLSGDETPTVDYKYGSDYEISLASAPFGTSLHHLKHGTDESNTTLVITIARENEIDVYLSLNSATVTVKDITVNDTYMVDSYEVLSVVGHGQYSFMDEVTITLSQLLPNYFSVKGWKIVDGSNEVTLSFNSNYQANYKQMTFSISVNYLIIQFNYIPFDDTDTLTLIPIVEYKTFSISAQIYRNNTYVFVNNAPIMMPGGMVYADMYDTDEFYIKIYRGQDVIEGNYDSTSHKYTNESIQYGDRVVVSFSFNYADYGSIYQLRRINKGGVNFTSNFNETDVLDGDNIIAKLYVYTIDPFVATNGYNLRFDYIYIESSFILEANNENAINEGALYQDKVTYVEDDTATISVISSKIRAGYVFDGWYLEDTLVTTDYTHSFTYNSTYNGKIFEARFSAINYTVAVQQSSHGGVYLDATGISSAEGNQTYNVEDGLTLYFLPDLLAGYELTAINIGNDITSLSDCRSSYTSQQEGVIAWDIHIGQIQQIVADPATQILYVSAEFGLRTQVLTFALYLDDKIYDSNEAICAYDVDNQGALNALTVTYGDSINISISNIVLGYDIDRVIGTYNNCVITLTNSGGIVYSISNIVGNDSIKIKLITIKYEVSVTSNNTNWGTVQGSGLYTKGQTVEFKATLNSTVAYQFVGFRYNATNEIVSTDTTYSFNFAIIEGDNANKYSYTAIFEIRSVTLTSSAYRVDGDTATKLEGQNGLKFKNGPTTYANTITVAYGTEVVSDYAIINGYTATGRYIDGCKVTSKTFTVGDDIFKAMIDGIYDIGVLYTVNTYSVTVNHNLTGVGVTPATFAYSFVGTASYSTDPSIFENLPYGTNIKVVVTRQQMSSYDFTGVEINGVKYDDFNPSNQMRQELSYTVSADAAMIFVFIPKMSFTGLTDNDARTYERDYTSIVQGITTDNIDIAADLKDYLVISYAGTGLVRGQPVDAGSYAITVRFQEGLGLDTINLTGATYIIKPIVLRVEFTGSVTKVYDGTAVYEDFSGLKLKQDDIPVNDRMYIKLDLKDASAQFITKISGVNYPKADVGTGYMLEFNSLQLNVTTLQYVNKLNNYTLLGDGHAEFVASGRITPRTINLAGLKLVNKIFDDTDAVRFAEGYSMESCYIDESELISIGDILDDVSLDYENILYVLSSKNVGKGIYATGTILSGTGLVGTRADNYQLSLPKYTGLTIHPYQITATGSYGTITITDINRELFFPLDLRLEVDVVTAESDSYRMLYTAIEPHLTGSKNLDRAYSIVLYKGAMEYNLSGSVVVSITTPDVANGSITNIIHYTDAARNINADMSKEHISFATSTLGLFVLISKINPVALWVILLISISIAVILIFLCIWFFIILPRRRERAYEKFNSI